MDAVGPSPDLRISLEPRAIARRLAIPAAFAAIAAAALVIAGGPLQTFADALGRALDADPRWVVAAVGFELASFAGYVLLLWLIAGRVSPRMNLRASTQITLGGAGVTRLLPTAGVGGAALTLWTLKRSGLATQEAARTLFAFLVMLYSVFLGAIAISGGLLATGVVSSRGSVAIAAVPGALAALAIVACLVLGYRARGKTDALRPGRIGALLSGGRLVGGGVRDGLVMLRRPDPRVLGRVRLVDLRRRRPVGDAPRVRRTALDRRGRARVLRRPGRQHGADPGRRERWHRRRARRVRRRCRRRAGLRPRLPLRGDLAPRRHRPGDDPLAARDARALEGRGRGARLRRTSPS